MIALSQILQDDRVDTVEKLSVTQLKIPLHYTGRTVIKVGGRAIVTDQDITVDISTDLDTGSMAANTLYYLYACVLNGTPVFRISTSAPSTGPTGVDYWVPMQSGHFYSNDSSQIGGVFTSVRPAITTTADRVPTGSWTANTTYSAKWERCGSFLREVGTVEVSGAPTSTTLGVDSLFTVDISKVNGAYAPYGYAHINDSGGSLYKCTLWYKTDGWELQDYRVDGTRATLESVRQTIPFTWASGDWVKYHVERLAIDGWNENLF
jgi:hypothetical protein